MQAMHSFSKQYLIYLVLPLLFLPKLNLWTFSGQTAGIRIDDLILTFMALLCAWMHVAGREHCSSIEKILGAIVLCSLFSIGCSYILYHLNIIPMRGNPAYGLRLLEYYLFFYIGLWACRFYNIEKILTYFVIWNVFLMLLQKFQLLGSFHMGNYLMVSQRVMGVSSFPTEMGLIFNFIYAYFIFSRQKITFHHLYLPPVIHYFLERFWLLGTTLFFGALVLLTGSRAPLAIVLLLFFIRFYQLRKTQKQTLWLLPIVCALCFLFINQSEGMGKRSHLLAMNNVKAAQKVWEKLEIKRDADLNEVKLDQIKNKDVSLLLRLHKWVFALKTYLYEPLVWIQGTGPGFAGPALDGGLVRLLVETGLLGIFLWGIFLYRIGKISLSMSYVVLSFILNMIFVDAHLAYKGMSIFFFIAGSEYAKQNFVISRVEEHRNAPLHCNK